MISIYNSTLDGICSAAIMNKYFNCIGLKIDNLIPIQNNASLPFDIIKQNESTYILNHFLNIRNWQILLSKTKNLVLINNPIEKYNMTSTSILTWKFFFGNKPIPFIIKLINNIILNINNCEITKNFKFGMELEDISPTSNFWNDGLNNIDSTIFRTLNNGKIINSFHQKTSYI